MHLMTRVLVTKFPYGSQFGGGEKHTLQLVDGLSSGGFSFSLCSSDSVLLKAFRERSLPVNEQSMGLEPVSLKGLLVFTFRMPRTYWQLRRLIQREKPDVLYCLSLTEKLLISAYAARLGVKVVWVEHLRIERWLLSNPYKWLYRRMSRFATVVGVSKSVTQQLVEEVGVQESHTRTIYNGVDLTTRLPSTRSEDGRIVLGSIGRLNTEKGYDVLLRAIAMARPRLEREGLGLVFEHISDGSERETLEVLAQKLEISDVVQFRGFDPHPEQFLAGLDLFALTPVRRESFGMSAAEASAQELPVIATDLSGLSEVVQHEETGLVCAIGDVEGISDAIVRLALDPALRRRFGKAGRERVTELFTLDRMVSEFGALFREPSWETIGIDVREACSEQPAGKAHYARELLQRVLPLLADTQVVLYSDVDPSVLASVSASVRHVVVSKKGMGWHFAVARRLGKDGVDLYVSPTSFLVPALVKRAVFVVHDLIAFRSDVGRQARASRIERFSLPRALRTARHVVTVSDTTARELQDRFQVDASMLTTISPSAVRSDEVIRPSFDVVKEHYALSNHPYFLSVGTLEPRKNYVRLLDAYASLRERRGDRVPDLVIVGKKGWEADAIYERIADGLSEHVVVTGFVQTEELPVFYERAIVFVYPSLYEGFGMPVLEAFVAGVPVITSTTSSLPEVAGDAAVLVDPEDVAALSSALEKVMDDEGLRLRLSAAGQQRALQYSWDQSAERFASLLKSL